MKQQALGRVQTRASVAKAVPPAASKPQALHKATAGLVAAAPLILVQQARAEDIVDPSSVDTAVDAVIGAVKTAADLVKAGVSAVDTGLKVAKQGYDVAAPVIEQGVKTIAPVVTQGAKIAVDAAAPAFKAALPVLSEAQESIGASLKSSNIDTVVSTASSAVSAATPVASKIVSFVGSTDPVLLGEYALAAAALVYLGPPLLGAFGGSFRGFAGEITAAQVLDSLQDGSTVLIDLRTQKEKENSGVPDVPSSAGSRCLEVEFAQTEDKKLRNSLRDPSAIEACVTGLQIASLKRVNKGTKIILLDRYGGSAATVAKELARKGFGKVYTVAGGFDGRGGWVQSKLQIKPAATVISAPPLARTSTTGTKKALPAPRS